MVSLARCVDLSACELRVGLPCILADRELPDHANERFAGRGRRRRYICVLFCRSRVGWNSLKGFLPRFVRPEVQMKQEKTKSCGVDGVGRSSLFPTGSSSATFILAPGEVLFLLTDASSTTEKRICHKRSERGRKRGKGGKEENQMASKQAGKRIFESPRVLSVLPASQRCRARGRTCRRAKNRPCTTRSF